VFHLPDKIEWNRSSSLFVHYLLGREASPAVAHLRRTDGYWPRIIDGVRPRDILASPVQPNAVTDAARHILLGAHFLKVCSAYLTLRLRDLAPAFASWWEAGPSQDRFIKCFGNGPVDESIWQDVAALAALGCHRLASLNGFVTEAAEAIEAAAAQLSNEMPTDRTASVGGISAQTMHEAVLRLGREMLRYALTRLRSISPADSLLLKWRAIQDVYADHGPGTADTDNALTQLEREEAVLTSLRQDRPPPDAWEGRVSLPAEQPWTVIYDDQSYTLSPPTALFNAFVVLYEHRGQGWVSATKIKAEIKYAGKTSKLMQKLSKAKGIGKLIESRASRGYGYRLKEPPEKRA
jgi:hypothetical protein